VSEESRKRMSENNWIKKLAKEDHPFFGKYHSDETKKRIAEKQKEYCKNKGNQFNLGKSKGRHRWTTIQKLSEANSGREPKWKGRVFLYDGPIGRFKLRSSYELAYANWLDSKGISWKYEPNFRLSDGRSFSPDFQLSTGEIIEIKGFWTDKAKVKWEMFCLEFPDLKKTVLMKEDLQKIGLNV
jgi:predicted nuclease of restriction endonuclease-like RecB superfamily